MTEYPFQIQNLQADHRTLARACPELCRDRAGLSQCVHVVSSSLTTAQTIGIIELAAAQGSLDVSMFTPPTSESVRLWSCGVWGKQMFRSLRRDSPV